MVESKSFKAAKALLTQTGQLIKPGSKEHQILLESGYGMTVDEAKQIIELRQSDPATYSIDDVRKARAMLEAFKATPKIISKKPGWVRDNTPMYGSEGA